MQQLYRSVAKSARALVAISQVFCKILSLRIIDCAIGVKTDAIEVKWQHPRSRLSDLLLSGLSAIPIASIPGIMTIQRKSRGELGGTFRGTFGGA